MVKLLFQHFSHCEIERWKGKNLISSAQERISSAGMFTREAKNLSKKAIAGF